MNNSNALNEAIVNIQPIVRQLAELENKSPLFVGDLIDSMVLVVRDPSPENGKMVADNLATCQWSDPLHWNEVDPSEEEFFGALCLGAVYLRNPTEFNAIIQQHMLTA